MGNPDVVQWLLCNRAPSVTAALWGHLGLLKWLVAAYPEHLDVVKVREKAVKQRLGSTHWRKTWRCDVIRYDRTLSKRIQLSRNRGRRPVEPKMTPMLLLLTTCLARVDARLQGLDGVQRLLDTLLDGSARYSLPQAAATGSVRLLDRVVCHVNNGDNDPCLDKTWFAKAMKHAILNNDLAMVHRIHYHHPEPLAHYSLNVALENGGSRDLVQWLMEHRHDQMCTSEPPARMTSTRPLDCCIRDSLAMAVRRRSFDVCRWLVDQGFVSQARSVTDEALITGDLDTVRHLLERTKNPSMSVSFVQIAFERGYVRVLQYLHEHGWLLPYSLPGSIGITSDVARDEASVIACLRQKVLATIAVEDYPEPLTSYANEAWKNLANSEKLSRAIADGHVEAIQWALTLVRGYQPIVVYSDAARAGHLHVLRWLASEWSSPTPTDIETVAHSASALGHLDILEWLHELYAYSCTAYVMDAAALSGQLRIVQWLYERGGAGAVTRESMDYAAGGDHLPLVQWFHAHSSAGCTTSAMDLAATNGHLDVVQWLHDNRTKGCTIHTMSQAAVAGHLDVVIWLHKHRSEGCNEYGMTQSNSDVLQWLLPNRLLTDIAQVMELAARRGDLHELQMLWTIRPDGLSVNVAECAAELGHQGILERIHGQYPSQFDTERVRSRSSKYSHVMTWLEPLFDTK